MIDMKRYDLIDTLRGLAIISMIGYHLCYIMSHFGLLISDQTLFSPAFWAWERSICISFILISGFSFSFGRHHIRRAAVVFGLGLLITLITCMFVYEIRIIFGILTFLGTTMFIMIPLDKAFQKTITGCKRAILVIFALCAAAFLFTYRIGDGYLGMAPDMMIMLPERLYSGYFMTFLGFMQKGFFSTDYFPLIPWIFLYLCGYLLHKLVIGSAIEPALTHGIRPLNYIGRHSLVIYLVHPVILYALIAVISMKLR